MQIREKFHQFIDEIKDEKKLQAYYKLLFDLNRQEEGRLFSSLNDAQKEQLAIAYNQSLDLSSLISHDKVKEDIERR